MKFFHHGFLVLIISGASLLGCRESKTNSPPAIVRGTPVSPVEEAKPPFCFVRNGGASL